MIRIVYQIDGMIRADQHFIEIPTKDEAIAAAKAHPDLRPQLDGVRGRFVYVPGKIVNIVTQEPYLLP